MDSAEAIELAREWISWRGIDYPTDELIAERFEAGWTVFAPVDIDESDPMAFLDMPVGRAIFLVGDSGRIEETSSSLPPGVAEAAFAAEERALHGDDADSIESEFPPMYRWLADDIEPLGEIVMASKSISAQVIPSQQAIADLMLEEEEVLSQADDDEPNQPPYLPERLWQADDIPSPESFAAVESVAEEIIAPAVSERPVAADVHEANGDEGESVGLESVPEYEAYSESAESTASGGDSGTAEANPPREGTLRLGSE